MLGPVTRDNLDDYLAAFADGELAAAQSLAMWTFLEGHPDRAALLTRLREQQELSAAAKRSLQSSAPADLHARIAALVNENSVEPAVSRSPWRRRIGYALAAAAGLLIGISATAFTLRSTSPRSVLPGDLVAKVGHVHAECSRLPEAMHNASFETVDAQLASTMKVSLDSTSAAPDLATVGFTLTGAGPCHAAGIETVHLLYHATSPRSVAAISLFVQADAGQYPALEANRVYRVSSPTSPFPTLAWRKDKVIYILLADSDKTESVVLQAIRPTNADEIITVASR
jgi:anti-sigma factor RsiW